MKNGKRVLWLHTQPEHYFNLLIDDLNTASSFEFVAAFLSSGPGLYKNLPTPKNAKTIFVPVRPGREHYCLAGFRSAHVDWQKSLNLIDYSAVIVAGYAGVTQRQVICECKRLGIPLLMMSDSNIRSDRGHSVRKRMRRFLKRQFLRPIVGRVDHMLTMNSRGVAYWRYYGAERGRITRCPFYADYARIEYAKSMTRENVFGPVGLGKCNKLILTAARLVDAKGLDLMIRAFLELKLGEQGWTYAIAGTGPLQNSLESLAGTELGRSVKLLGFVQPEVLMPLLVQADLFVLPSRFEPHAIVIGEAAAAGTPILASDMCGLAFDLVKPGVSGWMFRSEDFPSLKNRLAMITSNPSNLKAMRSVTRKTWETWFDDANPVKIVDRVLNELVNNVAS